MNYFVLDLDGYWLYFALIMDLNVVLLHIEVLRIAWLGLDTSWSNFTNDNNAAITSLLSSRAREAEGLAHHFQNFQLQLGRSRTSGRGARWQRGVPRAREAAATCPRGSRGRRDGGGTVCAGSRTQGSICLPVSHVKTPAALS